MHCSDITTELVAAWRLLLIYKVYECAMHDGAHELNEKNERTFDRRLAAIDRKTATHVGCHGVWHAVD